MQRKSSGTQAHSGYWRSSLVLWAVALVLSSCTALARIGSSHLEGTPDSTGLVVVEAEVDVIAAFIGLRTSASPVSGWLVSEDGKESVRGGSTTRAVSSDLVFFSNLAPGTWRLDRLEAIWTAGNARYRKYYVVPPELHSTFRFEVKAGKPLYVAVQIEEEGRDGSVRFERCDDAEDEREAWEHLADVYDSSPWEPVFRSLATR